MRFCQRLEKPSKSPTPRASFLRSHGPLPFGAEEDLKGALQARLADTPEAKHRVRLILGALAQELDPVWVRSQLAAWGIHPVSIVLAEADAKNRIHLEAILMPGQTDWTIGPPTVFRGAALPPGLVMTGPMTLDGCSELKDLPEDLITPSLLIQNCPSLRRLSRLPPGVSGLQVENAQNLVDLPDQLRLENGFGVSACPRLERLPSIIRSREVKISHCPGLRSISAKIRCWKLELKSLIHLRHLDLDLKITNDLELNIPSLQTFSGRANITGRLIIKCEALREVTADFIVGDQAVVEHCQSLEGMDGSFHVKGDLRIRRNPALVATPEGFVGGALELAYLPALRVVEPGMVASCRTVRIIRCTNLARLPYGVHFRGSMELLDLPALIQWPESMNVGLLTVLGCPGLPDPPPGMSIRTAFRRAGPQERCTLALALSEDGNTDAETIEPLRRMVRALKLSGASLEEILQMLEADGSVPEEALPACAAEGLGLREFLEGCAALVDGQGGEIRAARACNRASIHPGSIALVVKDLTKARWMAELYSESRDLAAGVMGEGSLRISSPTAWDLPENLAVPGHVKVSDAEGPARWPTNMRVLGGFNINVPGVELPRGA
jgi:hypothetical protein